MRRAHEKPLVYDGVLYWTCDLCGGAWHDWPQDYERLWEMAERYVKTTNFIAGITT